MAITTSSPGTRPARSNDSTISSSAARPVSRPGLSPPSSASRVVRPRARTASVAADRTRLTTEMALSVVVADEGTARKSWTSMPRPAWSPPLRMLTMGIGMVGASTPASLAIHW